MKKQRDRLELTFGEKDADLWAYLGETGLPKASVVKKILRDKMKADKGTVVESISTVVATPKVIETMEVKEEGEGINPETVEEKKIEQKQPLKKKSSFSGLATKR